MSKHQEFLVKLRDLMKEYDAHFDANYYESGCECCGGDYEIEIHGGGGVTSIQSSLVYSVCVGHMIRE